MQRFSTIRIMLMAPPSARAIHCKSATKPAHRASTGFPLLSLAQKEGSGIRVSFCFFILLSFLSTTISFAQLRFDIAGGYGDNYVNLTGRRSFYETTVVNGGTFGLFAQVRIDKPKRLNYGVGASFTSSDYSITRTTYGPTYNNVFQNSYQLVFANIYPLIDLGIDRKRIIVIQLSAPLGFRLKATETIRREWGFNNTDTAYSANEGFNAIVPRVSLQITGNIPLKDKRFLLTANVNYTGALIEYKKDVHPSQVLFGVGLGYRSFRKVAKVGS